MPTSKQVRSLQQRQMDRVLVSRAAQHRARRRRRIGTVFIVMLLIGIVAVVLAEQPGGNNASAPEPTTASTAPPTTLPSVKGKPCVGFKGTLPKGITSMPIPPGAAPTTLVVKDLKTGTGAVIKKTDKITADYVGVSCSTGKIFDASATHGGPQTFPLNGVIPGWTQGIPGMKVGGVRLLGIPSKLAYGSSPPQGSGIAPDEALWFIVAPTKVG
jgi:peptidylprolyl isomerase